MDRLQRATIQDIAGLKQVRDQIKEEMGRTLRRDQPYVVLRAPRAPFEDKGLATALHAAEGDAILFDLRQTKTGPVVYFEWGTRLLEVWGKVKTVDDIRVHFGTQRFKLLEEAVSNRADGDVSFEAFRREMLVSDLTLREFQEFARLGGQKIFGLTDFLESYHSITRGHSNPALLAFNVKDGYTHMFPGKEHVMNGPELAVNSTIALFDELKVQKLDSRLLMLITYEPESLSTARTLFEGSRGFAVAGTPTIMLQQKGEATFTEYMTQLANNEAVVLGVKREEMQYFPTLIEAKRSFVYFPASNNVDMNGMVQTMNMHPNIAAIGIDSM